MRETLLKFGNYNVIIVHWGEGSRVDYVKAVANTRLVGLEIAHLVRTLVVIRIFLKEFPNGS